MTPEIRAKQSAALAKGEDHPGWRGGQWLNNEGRVFVLVPLAERAKHPTVRIDGYLQRYVYVWNTHHPDDPVRAGYVIHHRNEDRTDDRIENLEKLTQAEHARLHFAGKPKSEETKARMRVAQQRRQAARRNA